MFQTKISVSTINKHYVVVRTQNPGLCSVEIDAIGKKEKYLLNLQKKESYFLLRTIQGINTIKFSSSTPIDASLVHRNGKRRPVFVKLQEILDDARRKRGTYWPDIRTSTGVQLREITFGRFMKNAASDIERLAFHNFRIPETFEYDLPLAQTDSNFFSSNVLKTLLDELSSDDGKEFIFLANEQKFSEDSRPAIQYLLRQRFGKFPSNSGPAWSLMQSNPGIGLLGWDTCCNWEETRNNDKEFRRLTQLMNVDPVEVQRSPSFPAVCIIRKSALAWISAMNIDPAEIDRIYNANIMLGLIPAVIQKAGFAVSPMPFTGGDQIIGHSVTKAKWVEYRTPPDPTGKNCCLFVGLLGSDGSFAPHALAYMQALKEEGLYVYGLGVSLASPEDAQDPGKQFCDGFAARANDGHDFGIWAAALRRHPEIWQAETLLFANDSMIPKTPSLSSLFRKLSESPYDVTGLTDSTIGRRHLQSYFIHLNRKALECLTVRRFWDSVLAWQDKNRIINLYEIGMTGKLIQAGLTCGPLYETDVTRGNWHHNPSIHCWKELIKRDFPFVKTQIIKEATAEGSIPEVMDFLLEQGFQKYLIPAVKI
ncbi:rhamnan synthesis F family protein [Agrobacterium tumefaciens]|uniref:rhamnan synthesis F family protein n=1 Tax=Agrobacterium tumefaciens TaxID=358 RepID=UPI00023A2C04|nr:glycosyltransferase [Agrobacterium tumefaciens 5A]